MTPSSPTYHNDSQLLGQFYKAATVPTLLREKYQNPDHFFSFELSYVFISEVAAQDVVVVTGVADELALEEGDVDDRRVEVDELEDEHFERQVVVEVRLRSVHL